MGQDSTHVGEVPCSGDKATAQLKPSWQLEATISPLLPFLRFKATQEEVRGAFQVENKVAGSLKSLWDS